MALYEFFCERDGAFERRHPIGTAPAAASCPACAGEARRVFSAPLLASGVPRPLVAAFDRAEKSRSEPEVVTSLPARPPHQRTPMAPLTPALKRLPRP